MEHCELAKTVGDLADTFVGVVMQYGRSSQRIDVTFDRYKKDSIKSATRQRRTSKINPIRRVIEGRCVPLPQKWDNFLALNANREDLANFLSNELVLGAPLYKLIIVSGGLKNPQEVLCSQHFMYPD